MDALAAAVHRDVSRVPLRFRRPRPGRPPAGGAGAWDRAGRLGEMEAAPRLHEDWLWVWAGPPDAVRGAGPGGGGGCGGG
jgi:hypothetical protein